MQSYPRDAGERRDVWEVLARRDCLADRLVLAERSLPRENRREKKPRGSGDFRAVGQRVMVPINKPAAACPRRNYNTRKRRGAPLYALVTIIYKELAGPRLIIPGCVRGFSIPPPAFPLCFQLILISRDGASSRADRRRARRFPLKI